MMCVWETKCNLIGRLIKKKNDKSNKQNVDSRKKKVYFEEFLVLLLQILYKFEIIPK